LLGKSTRCPKCKTPFVIGATELSPVGPAVQGLSVSGPAPASSKKALLVGTVGCLVLVCVAVGAMGVGAAALVGRPWLPGRLSGPAWQTVAPSEGGFSVLLPPAPTNKDQSDPQIVSAGPIHEVRSQASKTTYSVHYYDLAERPVNDYLYFGWMKKRLLAAGGK